MKEASGELNLTVVTIIAIAAVAGIGTMLYSRVKSTINDQWTKINTGGQNSTDDYTNKKDWSSTPQK